MGDEFVLEMSLLGLILLGLSLYWVEFVRVDIA